MGIGGKMKFIQSAVCDAISGRLDQLKAACMIPVGLNTSVTYNADLNIVCVRLRKNVSLTIEWETVKNLSEDDFWFWFTSIIRSALENA